MSITIKERPILMSAPMVRALLSGTKTQTRRIVKPQPSLGWRPYSYGEVHKMSDGYFVMRNDEPIVVGHGWSNQDGDEAHACPYGKPGDRLWLRETWQTGIDIDNLSPRQIAEHCTDAGYRAPWAPLRYAADGATDNSDTLKDFGGAWGKTRVSIHMPRLASRITLEITNVRVERLQDISEADAIVEGIDRCPIEGWRNYLWHGDPDTTDRSVNAWPHQFSNYLDARGSYSSLWESINGPGSWAANPWVWCLSFRRVKT